MKFYSHNSRRQNNSTTNQTSSSINSPAVTAANETTETDTPTSPSIQCNIVQQRPRTENGSNNNSPTCKYRNSILVIQYFNVLLFVF